MNQARFLALVTPLQNRMFRMACSLLKNEEEAKDIVQDVLVKLWEKREVLQGVDSTEAWCLRVTRNILLDRLKYNRYRRTYNVDEHVANLPASKTGEDAESIDALHSIKELIDKLPDKLRSFIQLRDVEGLAYSEIAQIMEVSLAEVKIGIFRARQAVRENLKKLDSHGLR